MESEWMVSTIKDGPERLDCAEGRAIDSTMVNVGGGGVDSCFCQLPDVARAFRHTRAEVHRISGRSTSIPRSTRPLVHANATKTSPWPAGASPSDARKTSKSLAMSSSSPSGGGGSSAMGPCLNTCRCVPGAGPPDRVRCGGCKRTVESELVLEDASFRACRSRSSTNAVR